jgi:hypothetical protein
MNVVQAFIGILQFYIDVINCLSTSMAEYVLSNITTFNSYFGNQQICKNKMIVILAEPAEICGQITLQLMH